VRHAECKIHKYDREVSWHLDDDVLSCETSRIERLYLIGNVASFEEQTTVLSL